MQREGGGRETRRAPPAVSRGAPAGGGGVRRPGALPGVRARRPPPAAYLIWSLRVFRARARTRLRAGLALKVTSCLVNGWMPLRALVAGLRTVLSLSSPGMVK